MPREPGQEIHSDCRRATMESDGTGSPGDFVALSGGQVTKADSTDNPKFTGVISNSKDNKDGWEAGEKISVIIAGVCVANVTAGVVAGDGLGPSATQGSGTSGGSAAEAFSDAGGEFNGPIPDGAAAVHLGGAN